MVHYESRPCRVRTLFSFLNKKNSIFIITKIVLRLYYQTFFRFKSTIIQDKVTDYCTWSWRCRISDCVRPDQQRGGSVGGKVLARKRPTRRFPTTQPLKAAKKPRQQATYIHRPQRSSSTYEKRPLPRGR